MEETLKILVDRFRKGLLNKPTIQVTDMMFSDEVLNFPDPPDENLGVDLSFTRCLVKKSQLTNIKIYNGNFELGFFTESTLENCTFESTSFKELKCEKCIFKNCSFIECQFVDADISETIFSNCKFEKGSLESTEFKSCDFDSPSFSDVLLIFSMIRDAKFSKFNKSVKFEGKFFLNDILFSKNGISGIFRMDMEDHDYIDLKKDPWSFSNISTDVNLLAKEEENLASPKFKAELKEELRMEVEQESETYLKFKARLKAELKEELRRELTKESET